MAKMAKNRMWYKHGLVKNNLKCKIVAWFLLLLTLFLITHKQNITENTTTENIHILNIEKNISQKKELNTELIIKQNNVIKQNIKENTKNHENEFGVWIWNSPYILKNNIYKIIDKISSSKFNTIYISIDDLSETTETEHIAYTESLKNFVKYSNKNNIRVDVVVGSKEWSQPKYREKAYYFINFVKKYNNEHPNEKINKIQFDIEPYLLPEYEKNKNKVLYNFIEFVDISSKMISKNSNVGISFVIPHFYDSKQNWTPNITYKNTNTSTFNHVTNLLKELKNSSIIIMSYRNFFEGKNGVNEISKTEIESDIENVKIIIAQETGNTTPSYTTFYNLNKDDLFTQIDKIKTAYGHKKTFGGIAIHDYDNFILLK